MYSLFSLLRFIFGLIFFLYLFFFFSKYILIPLLIYFFVVRIFKSIGFKWNYKKNKRNNNSDNNNEIIEGEFEEID